MHEMYLAQSVVTEAERCLDAFGSRARATMVVLEVGRLRAVIPDALRFCFEVTSQGTRTEGAELVIEEVPLRVRCRTCAQERELEEVDFLCPLCEGFLEVLTGKELLLRTIEIKRE